MAPKQMEEVDVRSLKRASYWSRAQSCSTADLLRLTASHVLAPGLAEPELISDETIAPGYLESPLMPT